MIVYKEEIVCFVNNHRVYFIRDNKLFWAIRKQGTHRTHGTLQNVRKRITVKNHTVVELGLVEESFLERRPIKQRVSRKDLIPRKFYVGEK